jgi:hypothetical protein
VGCHKKDAGTLPAIQFTPLAQKAPVSLNATTVDTFVDWVSTMPTSQVNEVKKQIALVKSDPKVVDAVAGKLSFVNLGSYGRQLIYLSILGEMKNERALGPLQNYLNSRDCPVFEERAVIRRVSTAPQTSQTSKFDACAGLKAAAVNMIAYINTTASSAMVLAAVSQHPSRTVRLSAINAYLYNNGDSPEAIATARRQVRREEAKFVGLPRLSQHTDLKEFQSRLSRFYMEHPEERPAQLKRVASRKPGQRLPQKLSVTPTAGPAQGEAK